MKVRRRAVYVTAMIISASYRTDIPAFYGGWFMNRLAAGFCRVANPYGGQTATVPLAGPAVDGFVFWTRNIGPFLGALERVARDRPFAVHYTITGYPRALEAAVTDADRAAAQARLLAATYGPRAVVWRYDPVLITDLTPADWHRRTFRRLAGLLRGATDEVVVSWAQIYRKTARNLAAAAHRHGFGWRDPDIAEKRDLLTALAAIAADHGMAMTLCTQPHLAGQNAEMGSEPALRPARCIDAVRLSDIAGRPIAARTRGNRPGCLCAESRDIGAYDTCPHGCVYCYAVQQGDRARRAHRAHDPDADMLRPGPPPPAGGQGVLL